MIICNWIRYLLGILILVSATTAGPSNFDDVSVLNTNDFEFSRDIVLASTIDGHLRALDTSNGEIRWTLQEEPVLRAPNTVKQGFTFLPNPQDGSLYVLKDGSLKKLPFNIPQLVGASPCKGSDGILYAGSKKDVWFGIDPITGVKVETLSSSSADRVCPASQQNTVFVGRSEYRISMFDEHNRAKTWNATFSDYSAHLLPENSRYKLRHYVSSSTGNILTVRADTGDILWERDLRYPIVALYLLQQDGLHKLPFTIIGKETMDNLIKYLA
ncbi:hypothetical protein WR25_05703 [Diploscapter pachys]|uniref:Pyrrolo-quinoline quinone repeat domain-containing protein n=1 Tax=Diploscapter pachys TaxID=2018661 RepID=A0A2A2L0J1_9BILA|nr:hypothetical protein WR25_05703 [Diploscapter pachys]